MANELKIRVVFDTGQAKANVDALTQSYTQFAGRVNAVIPAMNNIVPAMQQVQKGSANAAMTLQALNYTVRDSPYFFRDFSLGILAIGNNLNPLIDGLIRMKNEPGANGSLWVRLGQSLAGPQGVIFGFSILVSLIQAVTFAMAKNKGTTEEAAKSLSELADKYKNLAEKINDARKEVMGLDFYDWAAGYRAITTEVAKLTDELEKLIIKQQTFDNLKTGKSLTGQGYASIGAMLFAPSEKEKKELEDTIKLKEAQKKEAEDLFRLLEFAQAGYNQGTLLTSFAKKFSDKDLEFVSKTFRAFGQEIVPDATKKFGVLGMKIQTTKEEAIGLADALDKIIKPPKDKKEKEFDDFGYLKPLIDQEKALEKLKPFTKTKEDAEKLQETIQKVNDAIDQFNNRISNQQKTSEEALKFKTELEDNFQKELAKGIKDRGNFQMEWDEKIAQHAAKTIHDELTSKIESIRAAYKKLYDDLDKDKRGTPTEKATKKEGLDKAQLGEINEAKIDSAYKAIEDRMGKIKSMALSIGEDLFNAAINGKDGIESMIKSIPILLAKLALRVGIETIIAGLIKDQKNEALQLILAQSGLATASGVVAGEMAIIATSMTISAGAMTTAAGAMTAAAIAMTVAKAVAFFAQGGIVGAANGYVIPGSSYSGDKIPIMANSGEMVLNLSQQQNLLKLLSSPVSGYNQMMMGRMDAMNMNMQSGQPTILIKTDIDGLKFTKRTINPAQAKLIKGNVVSVS